MKLASIEKVRKDGNFYDDRGQIPEGKDGGFCLKSAYK